MKTSKTNTPDIRFTYHISEHASTCVAKPGSKNKHSQATSATIAIIEPQRLNKD
jgi:hypothetical protein